MTPIFQLTYISTAANDLGLNACDSILYEARSRNVLYHVTGLLLFNSRRFLQVLEGDEANVREIMEMIARDPRHYGLVTVGEKIVQKREFGSWAMAYDDGAGEYDDLVEKVSRLLDSADPSTRALFETSVKLYRRSG